MCATPFLQSERCCRLATLSAAPLNERMTVQGAGMNEAGLGWRLKGGCVSHSMTQMKEGGQENEGRQCNVDGV